MVVGGSAGDYVGEYMGGGTVVILRATNEEPIGRYIGAGMVGGKIYIRGEVEPWKIGVPQRRTRLERYIKSLVEDGVLKAEEAREYLDKGVLPLHITKRLNLWVNPKVETRPLNEDEIRELSIYIRRFNSLFNLEIDIEKEEFTIIYPEKH